MLAAKGGCGSCKSRYIIFGVVAAAGAQDDGVLVLPGFFFLGFGVRAALAGFAPAAGVDLGQSRSVGAASGMELLYAFCSTHICLNLPSMPY